jgi:hypothetical protein
MRILGSLLFDDLNAMFTVLTQHLADLWPLVISIRLGYTWLETNS